MPVLGIDESLKDSFLARKLELGRNWNKITFQGKIDNVIKLNDLLSGANITVFATGQTYSGIDIGPSIIVPYMKLTDEKLIEWERLWDSGSKEDVLKEVLYFIGKNPKQRAYKFESQILFFQGNSLYDQVYCSELTVSRKQIRNKGDTPTKISLHCSWCSNDQLVKDWKHQMLGDRDNVAWLKGIFLNEIVLVDDNVVEPDFWVIINACYNLPKNFDPSRTIVFRMEPDIETNEGYNKWLGTTKPSDYLFWGDHSKHRNNTEWWIPAPIRLLEKHIEPKTNSISAIVSNLNTMKGHKLRLEFLDYVQSLEGESVKIDVFGKVDPTRYRNYKGQLPEARNKSAGILPYKYHIAVENCEKYNYITEKFWDGLMGECFVFYWGCPNIEQWVDNRCFVRLPLEDKERSWNIIKFYMMAGEWDKRIYYIRQEKARIIKSYGMFSRVSSIIGLNSSIKIYSRVKLDGINSEIVDKSVPDSKLWEITAKGNSPVIIINGDPIPNFFDHLCGLISYANNPINKWELISFGSHIQEGMGPIMGCWTLDKLIHSVEGIFRGYMLTPEGATRLLSNNGKIEDLNTLISNQLVY